VKIGHCKDCESFHREDPLNGWGVCIMGGGHFDYHGKNGKSLMGVGYGNPSIEELHDQTHNHWVRVHRMFGCVQFEEKEDG
jgi:hypothetical protein